MAAGRRLLLFWMAALGAVSCESDNGGVGILAAADTDMAKLNEFIQANKENEVNTEALYTDLFKRFNAVREEFNRADVERQAMRRALQEARKNTQTLSTQNQRLKSLIAEVRAEQHRMTEAKKTVMQALGMEDSVNLTAVDDERATGSPEA